MTSMWSIMRGVVVSAVAAAATVLFVPDARALCTSNASCLCPYAPGALVAVVTGTVQTAADSAFLRVESTSAAADAGTYPAVGELVALSSSYEGERKLVSGDRVLAYVMGEAETVVPVSRIAGDGLVTCRYAPSFRLTVGEATKAAASPTCPADLHARGLPPDAPCDDTISGCSVAGPPSAASSTYVSGLVLLGVLATAGAVAWRQRRERQQ